MMPALNPGPKDAGTTVLNVLIENCFRIEIAYKGN
jgi:hypothetical protein